MVRQPPFPLQRFRQAQPGPQRFTVIPVITDKLSGGIARGHDGPGFQDRVQHEIPADLVGIVAQTVGQFSRGLQH
jgi:hypothetical protein